MPDITLKQIKEMCEKYDADCVGCPMETNSFCPVADIDVPQDWNLEEIQKRIEGEK